MRRSRFSEEQIIGILKEHQAGREVAELRRKYGISDPTLTRIVTSVGTPPSAKRCNLNGVVTTRPA